MSTAASRVTLHIYTARKCAIAPSGGQISVISRASDCRFGGTREPSDFCNRLLGGPWRRTRRRSAAKPYKRPLRARTSASTRSVLTNMPRASAKRRVQFGCTAMVSTPSAARHRCNRRW